MSDSGRQMRDCPHARKPSACLECLRAENERLAEDLDMANGCLSMVRDFLTAAGCECSPATHDATPPSCYPEWVACAMRAYAAKALREATGMNPLRNPTERTPTNEPPAAPGWYWYRQTVASDWQVAHVARNMRCWLMGLGQSMNVSVMPGEWAGPLTPPGGAP